MEAVCNKCRERCDTLSDTVLACLANRTISQDNRITFFTFLGFSHDAFSELIECIKGDNLHDSCFLSQLDRCYMEMFIYIVESELNGYCTRFKIEGKVRKEDVQTHLLAGDAYFGHIREFPVRVDRVEYDFLQAYTRFMSSAVGVDFCCRKPKSSFSIDFIDEFVHKLTIIRGYTKEDSWLKTIERLLENRRLDFFTSGFAIKLLCTRYVARQKSGVVASQMDRSKFVSLMKVAVVAHKIHLLDDVIHLSQETYDWFNEEPCPAIHCMINSSLYMCHCQAKFGMPARLKKEQEEIASIIGQIKKVKLRGPIWFGPWSCDKKMCFPGMTGPFFECIDEAVWSSTFVGKDKTHPLHARIAKIVDPTRRTTSPASLLDCALRYAIDHFIGVQPNTVCFIKIMRDMGFMEVLASQFITHIARSTCSAFGDAVNLHKQVGIIYESGDSLSDVYCIATRE